MPGLRLSVLDQSPISEGMDPPEALHNTIELAQLVDRLGFHRYWVAEHHGGPMLAGPSPEALIGPIAARTERIRVGSGGVMLPHYSPFKVAETFSLLSGLFPGRIDLGIGRAAGTDPMTTYALQRDRRDSAPDDFPQQLSELLAHFEDRLPADHPFKRLARHLPGGAQRPEVWLLGSSPQSAIWAGELGLPYSFADFINPDGASIAGLYRDSFTGDVAPEVGARDDRRANRASAPRVSIGAWVLCADTDEEAVRLASSARMAGALLRAGRMIAVPPVEKALRYLEESGAGAPGGRRMILGAPETVRDGIEKLAAAYGAEEVIAVTITFDPAARMRSYELLAGVFDLDGAKTAASVSTSGPES
jgi:luciferase family oxidoreductase group 1